MEGEISSSYRMEVVLSSPAWNKSYKWLENSVQASGNTLSFTATLALDPSWVEEKVKTISWETGTLTRSYDVQVRTSVRTVAQTEKGTVDESFSPQLTLRFVRDPIKGEYLTAKGLEESGEGMITRSEVLHRGEVSMLRKVSFVLMIFAVLGTLLSGWAYFSEERPKKVEELVEPFREMVVEVSREPEVPAGVTRVEVEGLEDLVRIAEGLGKPILSLAPSDEEHFFLVLDGQVRYEHRVKTMGKVVRR